MPVAARPSRAVIVLATESGRRAPASICAWMEGVPAVATSRGTISGLARAGERCAPASIWAWTEGVMPVATTPRRAIVGLDRDGRRRTPAVVYASMEGVAVATTHEAFVELARDDDGSRLDEGGCRSPPHLVSHSRTRLRPWEVSTGNHPCFDVGVPIAATPRGTADGLARDGGRRAPAMLAFATPRRVISTLAYDDGRRTLADVALIHDEASARCRSCTWRHKPPAEACSTQARCVAPKSSIAA
jgi:hypothetical protein